MLERIRQIGHHYLFKIFFFMLALAFAISLGNFNSSGRDDIIAKIGKEKITINDFEIARQKTIKQISGQMDPELVKSSMAAINKNVVDQLITQSLVKQEINSLGITIPEKILIDQIHNDPNFQKDGKFDAEIYKQVLAANHLAESALFDNLKTNIASKFLLDALVVNQPLKNKITDYLYNYLTEKRLIKLVNVDASELDIGNFSDDELKLYYQNHKDQFKTKELRSFSYITIDDKNIRPSIEIKLEEMQQEFDANKEDYSLPEARDFYHFLTPTQQVAEKIAASLKENSNHQKVAEDYIEQKVIGEKFVNQPPQSFLSNLDSSLFVLGENQISKPIKSELGWHVFKIIKIHPKKYKSFAEVKDQIKEKLIAKAVESQLYELTKQIEDDFAAGASFKEVANRYNLNYEEKKNIGSEDNNLDANLLGTVFQMSLNEESPIAELENNKGLYLVKLNEIIEPKIQDFFLIKDQLKRIYTAQKKSDLALNFAKKLQEKANEIKNIDKKLIQDTLGKNASAALLKTLEVSKPEMGINPEVNPIVLNNVFMLKVKTASVPQKISETAYSFAFYDSSVKTTKHDKQIYDAIVKMSDLNYKNEIYEEYLEYLKQKYSVQVNFKLLNQKLED